MSVNRERVAIFLRVWRTKFLDKLLSGANGLALAITFLGYFGLTYSNIPYALWSLIIPPAALAWAGLSSRPKFRVHPADVVGQKIELEELDSFLSVIPKVGLLGVHEVGKTTFLNALLHYTEPKRRTAKPYAVVVQLPNTSKPKYAAIIDSVGERHENQFQVINSTEIACLFLDHNSTATAANRSRDRMRDEQLFVEQLVKSRRQSPRGADRAIVIENKADLWANDPSVVNSIRRLADQAVQQMQTFGKDVRLIRDFSNTRADDVTRLLTEIRDVVGK